ncbi:MAG: cytochrome-c peroxidase [Burkholderiaceae bacterium]|jgi:cytochrome c peroxidase|nr:cytochrome-c peroxidase [Burkholderiaceae bacterium]
MRLKAVPATLAVAVLTLSLSATVCADDVQNLKITRPAYSNDLVINLQRTRQEPIQSIEPAKVTDPAKVELGKQLFFDPRLSRSGFISCNSCHNLSMGGSDNLVTSIGDRWRQGAIRVPTVFNASLNAAQSRDGRAQTLAEQTGGSIASPMEMNSTPQAAENMLNTIPGYRDQFKQVYQLDRIGIAQITDALAAFESTLVTPNSRFDQWLRGNDKAITANERAGYELFKIAGCITCHSGPAANSSGYQQIDVVRTYPVRNPVIGSAGATGDQNDRMMFKVPTLRNVELTYPYFHDGAAKTLPDAVQIMGQIQLGRNFTDDENVKIVAFLKTLTGNLPSFRLPQLPLSGDNTPRPNPFAPPASSASLLQQP